MDWWSELWLNEGFATWVGWLAVDHLHPDYQVWTQFVTEAVQTAQQLDSLRSSHPIEVPVKDALEIDQIFDAISYLKGSSVIRMLSNHLSVEVFLKGVSDYLKAHAYGMYPNIPGAFINTPSCYIDYSHHSLDSGQERKWTPD